MELFGITARVNVRGCELNGSANSDWPPWLQRSAARKYPLAEFWDNEKAQFLALITWPSCLPEVVVIRRHFYRWFRPNNSAVLGDISPLSNQSREPFMNKLMPFKADT
jgi:hypothetical protein